MRGHRGERTASVSAYRLLLRAYPVEFRVEFADEAARVFGELLSDAHERGVCAVTGLWWRSLVQVLSSGIGERAVARRRERGGAADGNGGAGGPRFDAFRQDVRMAAGALIRRPGFAAIVILLIGLGVGATTAIFSVVDAVLLRALPYPQPERLVRLDVDGGNTLPVPDYREWREHTTSFAALHAAYEWPLVVRGGDTPERISGGYVTHDLLSDLGARALRGRLFVADDGAAGAARVVVLSERLWRRWGGSSDIVGRAISVEGGPATVVGVVADPFRPPEGLELGGVEVYVNLDVHDPALDSRRILAVGVVGRIAPGLSDAAVRADLDRVATQLARVYPEFWTTDGRPAAIGVTPLAEATVGAIGAQLYMFLGAVGLLLLIACANVANLCLARATEREGELTLRAALGASRARLVAQLLTESLVLALAGGVLGIALTFGGVAAFNALAPAGIPRIGEVAVDGRVMAFALILSLFTGIAFGLAPAFMSARAEASHALRAGGRNTTTGRRHAAVRNVLVVGELAVALVLLASAGILFHSFLRLNAAEIGFEPERVLTLRIDPQSTAVADDRRQSFVEDLIARVERTAGVHAVAASWRLPFDPGHCCFRTSISRLPATADTITPTVHPVTTGFFETLGITLAEGRTFEPAEQAGPNVPAPFQEGTFDGVLPVLLNRTAARLLVREGSAVGRMLAMARGSTRLVVVGVVEDVQHWSLDAGEVAHAYVPYGRFAEWGIPFIELAVRHDGPAATVVVATRRALRALAPDVPVSRITTMNERISTSAATPRFQLSILAVFATVAFLLAAAGVYGSMLYAVSRRRRELGIRMALGARPASVMRMVLARGAALVALGTSLGLIGAWAATRLLENRVFGIAAANPLAFALTATLLATVALFACWLPARRAAAVDPLVTLKHD